MSAIEVGRLIRSNIPGFQAGCSLAQFSIPAFGALVRAPLFDEQDVLGVITGINIEDDHDGLVRQIARSSIINPAVMADQRLNRLIPIEISVVNVGYRDRMRIIRHHLPPRPALSLESLFLCEVSEIVEFISVGEQYLSYLLQVQDVPSIDLLFAHINYVKEAVGNAPGLDWSRKALRFLQRALQQNAPEQYLRLASSLTGLS